MSITAAIAESNDLLGDLKPMGALPLFYYTHTEGGIQVTGLFGKFSMVRRGVGFMLGFGVGLSPTPMYCGGRIIHAVNLQRQVLNEWTPAANIKQFAELPRIEAFIDIEKMGATMKRTDKDQDPLNGDYAMMLRAALPTVMLFTAQGRAGHVVGWDSVNREGHTDYFLREWAKGQENLLGVMSMGNPQSPIHLCDVSGEGEIRYTRTNPNSHNTCMQFTGHAWGDSYGVQQLAHTAYTQRLRSWYTLSRSAFMNPYPVPTGGQG